jgi:hypothetical protein
LRQLFTLGSLAKTELSALLPSYDTYKVQYRTRLIVVLRKEWNADLAVKADAAESKMNLVTLLYALPLGSAVIAGAGILAYLIYLSSEYHPSARPRRTPRD